MTVVRKADLIQSVADALQFISYYHPADYIRALGRAYERERSPAAKDAMLKKLIADHEPAYAAQWRSLGEEFARKMLAGIVGFELEVLQFQCKLKVNQHRPESHGALSARYAAGNERERELGRWRERLVLGG